MRVCMYVTLCKLNRGQMMQICVYALMLMCMYVCVCVERSWKTAHMHKCWCNLVCFNENGIPQMYNNVLLHFKSMQHRWIRIHEWIHSYQIPQNGAVYIDCSISSWALDMEIDNRIFPCHVYSTLFTCVLWHRNTRMWYSLDKYTYGIVRMHVYMVCTYTYACLHCMCI